MISGTVALLASCSNDFHENGDINSDEQLKMGLDIVLQERNPASPETTTKDLVFDEGVKTRSSGAIIGNTDILLGTGYNIGNSLLGDYDNVTHPVVDVNKVKEFDPEYIFPKKILGNESKTFAYTTFNRYEANTSVNKKVTTGFSVNLGLFSIGRKSKTEEVFTTQTTNEQHVVYGELNLNLRNSSFTLQSVEGARKIYARECLSNTFMRNLYSSTVNNLLGSYGDFVLVGYYTGGKAVALYAGKSKETYDSTSKEKDMSQDINASYKWDTGSASAELSFGKATGNSNSNRYKTENTEIIIKTLGGTRDDQPMLTAVKLNDWGVNLTSWQRSLNDENLHTIIDITDGGLCPIYGFVLEENLKRRFKDTSDGYLEGRTKLITPTMEIVRVFVRNSPSGEALYEVAAVLNTRQGDKIVLSDGKASTATDAELLSNENNTVFLDKANKIAAQKKNYFGLKITTNTVTRINPHLRSTLTINMGEVVEDNFYRFMNPMTNIEYIYDSVNKIAFSHLIDRGYDDWILDDYVIRDWVESIPEKRVSITSLANSYKIIGL